MLGGIASGSLDHAVVTIGLLGKNLVQTLSLSLHLCEDGISLTLGVNALLLGLGLGSDDKTALFNLLGHDDVGVLAGTVTVGTCILGLLLGSISLLQSLSLGNLLGSNGLALCLGLALTTVCVRVGNGNLGLVLTLHGLGIGFGSTDTGLADSSARPISPTFSCSATRTLASLIALAAAS